MNSFLPEVAMVTIAALAPILAAALGGLATEYVGVLNIALEGLIMAGGFAYVAVGGTWGPAAGMVAAITVPAVLALAQDGFARKARADAFVVGLAMNMLIPGAASVMSELIFGTKGVVALSALASGTLAPGAVHVPVVGPVLFSQRWSDILALLASAVVALGLALTPFGLRLRAAGMKPESVELAGLSPGRLRDGAYALSGAACGVAGMAMAAAIGAWVPNLSAGRGWIALVAIYLGRKRLKGTFLASLSFAALLALATLAQAVPSLPAGLLGAVPYTVTAVAVILGSAARGKYARKIKA
ncbi:MAG: ABC transporter permease [Spirochaetia bacterium]|nr:ABC transporter permease [Spirochaetia bacterium]